MLVMLHYIVVSRQKTSYYVLGILLLICSVFSIDAVAVLLGVGFLYYSIYLRPTLNTLVLRAFIALLLYIGSVQIAGMLNWLLPAISVTVFTALLVFVISLFSVQKTNYSEVNKFNMHDIFSAFIALGAVSIVLLVSSAVSGVDSAILNGGNTNHDDISHVSLLQTVFDNQGYDYGTNEEVSDTMIIPQLTAYPLGWHVSQLPFVNAADELGYSLTPWNWQVVYFVSKMIGLGLLVFATTRYLLLFVSSSKNKIDSLYIYFSVLVVVGLITIAFFSALFALGFYNYIGVFILLLGLLLALSAEKQEKIDDKFKFFMIYGSIFVAASITTWLLVSPLFGLVLLSIFIGRDLRFKDVLNIIKVNIKPFAMATLILLIASLQLYIQFKYTIKTDALNEGGGIMRFSDFVLLGLFGGSVAAIIYAKKNDKVSSLFAPFVIFGIGAGLLYLYQVASIGEAKYYAIKLLYLPVFIALLIVSIYFIKASQTINRNHGILTGLLFVAFSALFIPVLFNISTSPVKAMLSGKNQIQPETVEIIKELFSNDDYKEYEYLVYTGEITAEDQAASRILNLNRRFQNSCEDIYYGIFYDRVNYSYLIPEAIKNCFSTPTPTIIVTNNKQHPYIKSLLGNGNSVRIININDENNF
jgi:hypothetical protein